MTAQVTPPQTPTQMPPQAPPRRTPRKPSHWARNIWIGVIGVFVLLAALGSAQDRPTGNTGPTVPPGADAFDAGSFDPNATDVASPTPLGKALLSIKGTGPQTSDEFQASGDTVDVTYDFKCTAADSFTINFFGTNGSPLLPDVIASEFDTNGSSTTTENLNSATGPFHVEIDSACTWSVEVVGAP